MGRKTKEDYRRHYREYQSRPEQIKKRALRNKARRAMVKRLGKAALAGKDIDHRRPLRSGGSNGLRNLRAISIRRNRGWKDGV